MELYVNGSKLDVELENEKTIGDVLKSFETECQKTNATTVNIAVDGCNVPPEDFEKVSAQPLKDDTKIELGVISQAAIEASFEQEKIFCHKLSGELKELSLKFQSGNDKEANIMIASLADLIDNICHTASLSALFPERFGNLKIDNKSFSEFFSEFSQIFKDFEQAISSGDTVLMGDLAEYEISPRLEQLADSLEE